jgi:hypothetical protein
MSAATIFNRKGMNVTTTTSPVTKNQHVLVALSRFAEMIISLKEYEV